MGRLTETATDLIVTLLSRLSLTEPVISLPWVKLGLSLTSSAALFKMRVSQCPPFFVRMSIPFFHLLQGVNVQSIAFLDHVPFFFSFSLIYMQVALFLPPRLFSDVTPKKLSCIMKLDQVLELERNKTCSSHVRTTREQRER